MNAVLQRAVYPLLLMMAVPACTPVMPRHVGTACADAPSGTPADHCRWYSRERPYLRRFTVGAGPELATLAAMPDLLPESLPGLTPPLSPGDRVQVMVRDDDEFSGVYEVDLDGTLRLPYLPAVVAAGRTTRHVEQDIARALVEGEFILAHSVRVSVRPQQWAAVQVTVSGAVFQPGRHLINDRAAEERVARATQLAGDYAARRELSNVLQACGGVRPDAQVERILVTRAGQTFAVDLSGVLHGSAVSEVMLAAGDSVYVPSSGTFREPLVRPSQITPPGIRVFLSNLTVPAQNNAGSAVNRDATRLPYGTRLLNAAMAANCVGGTGATNSGRFVIMVSNNPLDGGQDVVDRSIAQLLAAPSDAGNNPVLMPGDGVSCYDSGITNVRDIARTLIDIVTPVGILGGL